MISWHKATTSLLSQAGLGNTRVSVVRFSLNFLEQAIITNQCSFHYFMWHCGPIHLLIQFSSVD